MNNEPVAWMNKDDSSLSFKNHGGGWQPLYTHPVKELPTKEDEYWLMVEVLRAKVKEQQAEIKALKDMLEEEGIGVSQKYLNERIAELGKAQEK